MQPKDIVVIILTIALLVYCYCSDIKAINGTSGSNGNNASGKKSPLLLIIILIGVVAYILYRKGFFNGLF